MPATLTRTNIPRRGRTVLPRPGLDRPQTKYRKAADAMHEYRWIGGRILCLSDHGTQYDLTDGTCDCRNPGPVCSHLWQFAAATDALAHCERYWRMHHPAAPIRPLFAARTEHDCIACGVSLWRAVVLIEGVGDTSAPLDYFCAGCGVRQLPYDLMERDMAARGADVQNHLDACNGYLDRLEALLADLMRREGIA